MHCVAVANAIAFFFFWLVVLLSGADKPPPRGFLWLIPLLLLCAAAVYWRVPTYIDWSESRQPGRFAGAGLEGLAVGLLIAVPFVASGGGEPTVQVSGRSALIWFAALGTVGMLNALALYGLNSMLARRLALRNNRSEP